MAQTTERKTDRKTGRPRCEESRAAILETTWKLLETIPLRNLAIETIARESGVGKTTIYRWWPNKAAVVMDALLERALPEIQFPEAESVTAAISEQMRRLIKAFAGQYGRIVAQIIAEGQACPEALASYRDRFLSQRRTAARAMIQQGIDTGEFDPDLDPDLAIDILYGAIYFRLLVGHLPLNSQFADELAEWAPRVLKPR